jgi:H+/Cl- antiporter ClcA
VFLLIVLGYVAGLAGVVTFTLLALKFTGRAMARREPRRRLMAGFALLCALLVPGSAAAGFALMAAVQFYAGRNAALPPTAP